MEFVAIDFETANEKRNSPCSIGIVKVKNSEIVEEKHFLIKPKEMRFSPMNIWIHGIRPEQVENEREFYELWDDIKGYFEETLIVAHNASFDISVLRSTLDLYGIDLPSFNYVCTMKMAKNFYPIIENAKLNTVNEFLGFDFKHHDALEDARACSNILLNISDEVKMKDISEIVVTLGMSLGEVTKEGYLPCSSRKKVYKVSKKIAPQKKEKIEVNTDLKSFENQVVVFTGALKSMGRGEAMCLVRSLGGATASSVTKKTTCLVTGIKNYQNLLRSEMSNKLRKAMLLKEEGQNINILTEEEFIKLIGK